ncbi:MAG: hypothetical protein QOI11_1591 [Candidatus Eremiobacteraeota bacterium]|jgi:hypothetical protein|nr:hypothetical protein [Candidatus Eremiobacteraeota bacterium]
MASSDLSAAATAIATFPSREQAQAALDDLHRAGYRHTWLGLTETVDPNSFGGAGGTVGAGRERVREVVRNPLARWFHRDEDHTLYDVLREHGVEEEDAREIDGSVTEGDAVVIVCDVRDPAAVQDILMGHGGRIRGTIAEARLTVPTRREDVFVSRAPTRVLGPGPY